ncbi:L,D-transpeptidase family protein [Sphingomonas sp. HDW15A]|uniref:L,D-transpeptidase family protein n=1 Tax=Sphingomonas sp. HDW15A TaxID=2714942 RepID=UPI00140BE811|nr:L,D-transpeptidase family protein [Sphingomonas sp. HDW15A]QIK95124.1 L,D-transpeptidase family protein [Sphingomonas sp. HDW15A]
MISNWKTMALAAASMIPLAGAWGQPAAQAPTPRATIAQPTAPATASDPIAPLPDAAVPPPAPVLPPPIWMPGDAQALLTVIPGLAAEGLDPRDYDDSALETTLRQGDPMAMSKAATDLYRRIASDLAQGHVRGADRNEWHIKDDKFGEEEQMAYLRRALAEHNIIGSLRALLPTHPQYLSLKAALARADKADTKTVHRIRLNMDRWRWLPKDLGDKYIIVNVPSFHATLVENGATRWKRRAIAGAIKTKTPQISATATGVVINPWWEVPPSIGREVAGKKGYVAVKGKDGKVQRWRQPPGPSNALGKMKFVMPNSEAIYLHDTNARSRFNSEVRALSHGCVRTQDIVDLAKLLLADDNGEWTPEKVDEQIASGKTVTANFVKPLPVYIVYFSAAALNDGTIVRYSDLYNRDDEVIAALLDGPKKGGMQTAAR